MFNFKNNKNATSMGDWIGIWVDNLDKGGLEEVVSMLATKLSQRNYKIKVLCNGSGGLISENLIKAGLEVICFHKDEKALYDFLKNNRPLLLNTHYTKDYLYIAKELKIPLIETVHTTYLLTKKQWRTEKRRAKYFFKFIAVSKFVGDYYKNKVKIKKDIQMNIVNNAGNNSKFLSHSNDKSKPSFLNISDDETIFLCVGSYYGIKNQLGLIFAFEKALEKGLENAKLVLCGNILDENYYTVLKEFVSNSKYKDNYVLLDYINDIYSVYSASDVLIVPSYVEGWCIAATEALYCGLGLIHTKCGSAEELCVNEYSKVIANPFHNIFVDEVGKKLYAAQLNGKTDNTDELVEAIFEFNKKRDELRKNRSVIAKVAQERFSIDKMIDGYINIFSKYMNKN